MELWRDRITYRSLTLWDQVVKATYALAPLAAGRSFRLWLHERSMERDFSTGLERAHEEVEIPG
jgi:hypothetical protein